MITYNEMKQSLIEAGFPAESIVLSDGTYSLPDVEYIGDLGRRYASLLDSMGAKFSPERMDCDDFALQCVAQAKRDHAMFGSTETGLAVGIAFANLTSGIGHALVLAVHRIDGNIVVAVYEPQPKDRVTEETAWLAPNTFHGDASTLPLCLSKIDTSKLSQLLFCYF